MVMLSILLALPFLASLSPSRCDPLQKNVKFSLSDASSLISAPLPKLKSVLKDAKGGGLERALLEVVVSKTVTSRAGATR